MDNMDFETMKNNIEKSYNVIEYNNGHFKSKGMHSYNFKNPFWRVKN